MNFAPATERETVRATLAFSLAAVCAAILIVKAVLIHRLNVNWDEFNFLSHVHEASRGELRMLLQGAYTHLFRWITLLPLQEVDQVLAGRWIMWCLLAASCWLIYRLARVWTSPAASMFAPLCFLVSSPIVRHGASFRYDSLILPLFLLLLWVLAAHSRERRAQFTAGVALGFAAAISIKAVFMVPVIIALVLLDNRPAAIGSRREGMKCLLAVALTAASTLLIVLALHSSTLAVSQNAAGYAGDAARKTLLESPFFPRREAFYATRHEDWVVWLLILLGVFASAIQERYRQVLALALSLLPIVVYRNAWPYYYVVMLAPAVVLASVFVETIWVLLQERVSQSISTAIIVALAALLSVGGAGRMLELRRDELRQQRDLVAAVHEIFPHPVNYVDHSGMIGSFIKVNPFLSTWGVEDYRRRGQPFMKEAIERYGAPLILANRSILDLDSPGSTKLLAEDRDLISKYYVRYWGPIRIAGVEFDFPCGSPRDIDLPFPGPYRLESSIPLVVNGSSYSGGEVFSSGKTATVRCESSRESRARATGRMLIASASAPPKRPYDERRRIYRRMLER